MTATRTAPDAGALDLRAGDLVEVRGEAEILATLDERGELEGLPFMPEMLAYCGRRLTVHKVAHKVCDTIGRSGMRRMERAVHLTGARCDGGAHGGCQTACLMYWKEAWLKRVEPGGPPERGTPADPAAAPPGAAVPERRDGSFAALGAPGSAAPPGPASGRRLLPLIEAATRKEPGPDGEERFSCQGTEMLRAAPSCLPLKDVRQYVMDVRTGNAGPLFVLRALLIGLFNRVQDRSRRLPGWLRFRDGMRWGFVAGRLTGPTPDGALGLRPGELVRIKSKAEILGTLNQDRLNRGMGFDEEMSRYCGRTARVLSRVDRCIDERTGRMLTMKSPCIVLEGIVCAGAYTVSCPRAFIPFWREIWLERVEEPA
ncbi:hypothetical protein [Streptosporangium sandarakinum]|uniref:Uncharacterized protein n=1 Tax=Streptosporangium sandarakinum TaxID=1260955 RepID=A0A852UZQ9_9ACTN|nr:hypothetical protein [Streptosporangium sandarakinum]NYF40514.1 hypothetical protein [Streptosporangium sandarakinum]